MVTLWQDIRYGLRTLARNAGFTAVAVLTLALGIGANAAIFSVAEQVLLRSLPVKDPGSLAIVVTEGKHVGASWGAHVLSYPMFKDFRDMEGIFDGILCWRPELITVNDGEGARRIDAQLVSAGYFDVLGVPLALGRTFVSQDETAPGANPVAVLSHDFWRIREIGIRMALGARPGRVLGLVMREGVILAGVGAGIGLAGAAGLTRVLRSMLFGVTATDPFTFVAAATLLIVIALAASYLPARRAVRVDPMAALRYE